MEKLNTVEEGKLDSESTVKGPVAVANPAPECEMDALLLGRIGVSVKHNVHTGICKFVEVF